MKRTVIGLMFVGASLAVWGVTGCGKKEASCDAVFEHMRGLAPAAMQDMFDGSKSQVVEKCDRLTTEQRRCILRATDLSEVADCKRELKL